MTTLFVTVCVLLVHENADVGVKTQSTSVLDVQLHRAVETEDFKSLPVSVNITITNVS